jgi:hypothetical protein
VKVLVYVEGPSDRAALEALLKPVILQGQANRVGIRFLALGGKAPILNDVGRKAADDLRNNPDDWHFALPDLYPMKPYAGTPNAHDSFAALSALLHTRFKARAAKHGLSDQAERHFRVHCLKHDLEALLLAAPDALRKRLGTEDALRNQWRLPVEDQNDAKPPKRVIEDLFNKYCQKRYVDTSDAPWILGKASLDGVQEACQQRFKAFVGELRILASGAEPE